MNKKYHTLYQIVNKINGMIYIGIHSTNNLFDSYMGSGKEIKSVLKEFGKKNFIKYIIGIYDNKYEMKKAEMKIVNKEFVLREDTYNLTTGGGVSPLPLSQETRDKMSLSHKGILHTDEAKLKMSKASKGVFKSEEHIQKLKEAWETRKLTPVSEETKQKISIANSGENNFFYGKELTPEHIQKLKEAWEKRKLIPVSEETKQKISLSNMGRIVSEETRQKQSESKMGVKLTEEHKQNIGLASKNRKHRSGDNLTEKQKESYKNRKSNKSK